jgi:hypothetical protein
MELKFFVENTPTIKIRSVRRKIAETHFLLTHSNHPKNDFAIHDLSAHNFAYFLDKISIFIQIISPNLAF